MAVEVKDKIVNLQDLLELHEYAERTYAKEHEISDIQKLLGTYESFNLRIVNSLPSVGIVNTIYLVPKETTSDTEYDKYLWVERKDANNVEYRGWTPFASEASSTIVVNDLSTVEPDENMDYILKTGNGYMYYKYINGGWQVIAGSLAYVDTNLPEIKNGDEYTDYYILTDGVYLHYRFIQGRYYLIGRDSYTKSEIDTMLQGLDTNGTIVNLQNAIDGLREDVDANASSIEKGLSDLGDAIEANETRIGDLEDRATSHETNINGLKTSVNENSANIVTNQTDIANIKKTVEQNKSDIAGFGSSINALSSSIDKNTTDIATHSASIASLGSEITKTNQSIENIEVYTYENRLEQNDEGKYCIVMYQQNKDGTEEAVSTIVLPNIGTGSGTSSSSIITIDRITPSPLTITPTDSAVIDFMFSCVDTSGDTVDATYVWKLGNDIISSGNLAQGKNTIDVTNYCSIGSQKFTLIVTDINGSVSSKTWTVEKVDIRLETTFSDKYINEFGREVIFTYTPYGGKVNKVVHFKLDGREIGTFETTASGLLQQYRIPAQSHGSHLFECYITATVNGVNVETDHIFRDIIWFNESYDAPVIGCIYRKDYYGNVNVKQYNTFPIEYNVFDPKTASPTVTLTIDGKKYSDLTLTQSNNIWAYKANSVGTHVLKITCRTTTVTINVVVEDLGVDLSPITAGLKFDFNPVGLSNSSANRLWKDSTNQDIALSVSDNFDWNNGGYQIDEEGNQYFMVKAGTRAVISHNLFSGSVNSNPSINGLEFKVIFKVENVKTTDSVWLSCLNDNIGLQLKTHDGNLLSSASNMSIKETYLYMPYSEDDIIELEFNINPLDRDNENSKSYIMAYEDGVGLKAMIYDRSHQLYQYRPVPITIGSDECDVRIYRMKAYDTSLSDSNILTNFIADAKDSDEMIARFNRNQIYDENNNLTPDSVANACPQLKVIKIEAPYFTNDKKDFRPNTKVECIHKGGDAILDNWVVTNAYHAGQGTTSNEYGYAGRNLDIIFNQDGVNPPNDKIKPDPNHISKLVLGDGTTFADGKGTITLTRTSVGTNWLNIKVNIASSENANNALLQKRYNDFLTYTSLGQQRDPFVKNDMEFVNCVVFIKETDPDLSLHREHLDNDWHFYAIGNIGDSKKTDFSRAYDQTDMNEFTLEISDNTLNNSTFQSGVYLDGSGRRVIESEKDIGTHKYIYPITKAEWGTSNKRYLTLYADKFSGGDSSFPVYDSNGNFVYEEVDGKREQKFASDSFELRYGCKGDFKDGKLINKTAENQAQLLLNADVWRAFYTWVVTSTNEEFVNELSEWCIKDSVLYWYLFTHHFTMIDNRAKNTFWHFARTGQFRKVSKPCKELLHVYCEQFNGRYVKTQDTSVVSGKTYYTEYAFDMWDYDNDTALGINNSGELTMTYGKEDVDYKTDGQESSGWLYNAAESTFWCRLRDLTPSSELTNMYQDIETCWNANNIINEFDNWQAMFPEELWRLDIEQKYLRTYQGGGLNGGKPAEPTPRFLQEMMQGRKKYQRRHFVRNQQDYFGTKYLTSTVKADQIMFRCNTPVGNNIAVRPNYTLNIVPYSDMYISVLFGNSSPTQVRAKAGQTYTINCPYSTMDDTAVLIYCASKIQALNDLSACYIHDNDFSKASKLKTLVVGSSVAGYENTFLTTLNMGNNVLLEKLDIRNCPNLGGSLNLTSCGNLKELYATGTAISAVTFATNGKVETAYLPASINALTMKYLNYLTNFNIESYSNMRTLTIYGGAVDMLGIVRNSINTVQVLDLVGIEWTISDTDIMNKMLEISSATLSGKVTLVGAVRLQEIEAYREAWNDLTILYSEGNIVSQYAVKYVNYDDSVLYIRYFDRGSIPTDPIQKGYISTPTKPSDGKYTYEFSGWSDNINNYVVGDMTITAQYSSTPVKFTVKWYDAVGGIVLCQKEAEYGTEAVYDGVIPENSSEEKYMIFKVFKGWDKSTGYVRGNMDVYPTWEEAEMPPVGKELKDMSVAELYAVSKMHRQDEYFDIRDSFILHLGQDYDFTNVESEVLAKDLRLKGTTSINTGIKLFSENSPSFTLLLDYEIFNYPESVTSSAGADNYCNSYNVASCFDKDNNAGFRLSYDYFYKASGRDTYPYTTTNYALCNSTGTGNTYCYERLIYGDKAFRLTSYNNRNQIVIRHIAGSDTISFYVFNPQNNLVYYYRTSLNGYDLRCSNNRYTDATLILGALPSLASIGKAETDCMIYNAKIWYDDLGDDMAKNLAFGLHEDLKMYYYASEGYNISDGSGITSMSFFADNALNNQYHFNYNGTNTVNNSSQSSSSGYGWYYTTLRKIFREIFFKYSIPVKWKTLIKECALPSYFESGVTPRMCNDKIYIPSYAEVVSTTTAWYIETTTSVINQTAWLRTYAQSFTTRYAKYSYPDESAIKSYSRSNDPTDKEQYPDDYITPNRFDLWRTGSYTYMYLDNAFVEENYLGSTNRPRFSQGTGNAFGTRNNSLTRAKNNLGYWKQIAYSSSYNYPYYDTIVTRSNYNSVGGSYNYEYYMTGLYGGSASYGSTYNPPNTANIHICFSI